MFPAYNEKENLTRLLPELDEYLKGKIQKYEILIIDDGSTDHTKDIAKYVNTTVPIRIISHEVNKGIGQVFKTGLQAIKKLANEEDLLIILEADGTSDYTLIPTMVERLKSTSDIVIASRYIKGGAYRNFPLKRHLLSLIGNMVLKVKIGKRMIRDYTIFFRGYKVSLIKKALGIYKDRFITSKTFLANTEVLKNLATLTDKISEVPFVYSYDKKMGKSKMPILKTLLDYLKFLIVG
jgi:dolichol-phosphate mannosyltransferase